MNDKHAATSPQAFALKPDLPTPAGRLFAALTQRDGYAPAEALAFMRDVFPDITAEYLADRQTLAGLVAAANGEASANTSPVTADPLASNDQKTPTAPPDANAVKMGELVEAANSAR